MNNALAAKADAVVRVVCGVPVYYKGVGTPMTVLQTIAVAFAMFSAVPVPQFVWGEKEYAVFALCAFPLVGLLCGALCVRVRGAACRCLPRCARQASALCLYG